MVKGLKTAIVDVLAKWELQKRWREIDLQHAASQCRLDSKTKRRKALAKDEVRDIAARVRASLKTVMKSHKQPSRKRARNQS